MCKWLTASSDDRKSFLAAVNISALTSRETVGRARNFLIDRDKACNCDSHHRLIDSEQV